MEKELLKNDFAETERAIHEDLAAVPSRKKKQNNGIKRGNFLDRVKGEFTSLAAECGEYDLKRFDHLRKDFIELYETKYGTSMFRHWARKEGTPAKKWLEIHSYPSSKAQVRFLEFVRSLTEESQEAFMVLLERYLFMIRNDPTFKEKCNRQNRSGFNCFTLWMEKNHYKAIFKTEDSRVDRISMGSPVLVNNIVPLRPKKC